MGINVTWTNERDEALGEVYDQGQILSRLATERWLSSQNTACLRFIEPWGDTTFNQTQIPVLLAELQSELSDHLDPATVVHLQQVIELVVLSVNQTHTYIKFIGD